MFDSLNRQMLAPYGCSWTHTPNFQRLSERTVRFNNCYVGSMPCMPARREMHTGRPNFLHRSWGPLEPFDDSMPEMLKAAGVYTHLATDHYHYFEDGGATYHGRFNTYEFFRGQEGDPWMGQVARPKIPHTPSSRSGPFWEQDWINRQFLTREQDQPGPQTFHAGLEFIRRNAQQDRWFLQLETFDPHEPFFTQRKYKDLFAKHYDEYKGRFFDWPDYRKVNESPAEVEHCRYEYAALLAMCDAYMGEVLKAMDELDLWKDTMLIVCTDHGFMLGEHECWAKCWQPMYDEVAHTPLFIWDPRCGQKAMAREALVQTIDLAPTVLEFFGVPRSKDMIGRALRETIAQDTPVREAGLFGVFGGQVNVTDGRYVYMRAPATADNGPLFEYTHMPTHMRAPFAARELAANIELAEPFGFTKGCRTMKIQAYQKRNAGGHEDRYKTLLFDLQTDPGQQHPINDPVAEKRMIGLLLQGMKECEAPAEQYVRLGLERFADA